MSTSYTSAQLGAKKVPELKAILTELKLSTTGVKADLTARILEHQEKQGSTASNGEATADSTAPASSTAAGTAESGEAAKQDSAPAAETTKQGDAPVAEQQEDAPALPEATDKSSEAEKRAARLKRFGAPAEELAKLDRAARFGNSTSDSVDDKAVSKLDSELSDKRIRTNANGPAKANGNAPAAAARPKPERTQSGTGKPQSKAGKPQSTSGGKPKSAGKPAPAPAKALDPEEEERRKKRAERFNAAS